jgi:hypothetical protein
VIGHDASNASRKLAELAFHVSGRKAEGESAKPIEEMVGAIGFEFTGKRSFNKHRAHGGHRRAVEGSGKQC